MRVQHRTGRISEEIVANHLESIGLQVEKPVPDRGIDLMVSHPDHSERIARIQIKGRGTEQTNKKYRWFQIRTTTKQREETIKSGEPVYDAYKKKVNICDFFVLVSEKYNECWVFPSSVIHEIVNINREKYGNRKDNKTGYQAEMDLDFEKDGKKLTARYSYYLNNFSIIEKFLKSDN